MDFHFQGFSPAFSLPLLLFLLVLVVAISWWGYTYLKSAGRSMRWTLILLRSAALFILILMLLNPYLQIQFTEEHLPEIAVYLDNSESMGIERGDYAGADSYRSILDNYRLEELEGVDVTFYRFDGRVTQAEGTDLDLSGSRTNLDEVLRHIQERSDHTVAALLFSDGIITRGRDPAFRASRLPIPLFTVPVGDTTETRDVAITDVHTNETGYTDTRQTVEVSLRQEGYPGQSTIVRLLKEGEEIDSREIDFGSERSHHRITFELEFENDGIHSYEIYTPELEGEMTLENNLYPFTVYVEDETSSVYHMAFEIHPDVKMIRSILDRDPNIDLTPLTWVGNRFLEQDSPGTDLNEADLIVIHGPMPEQSGIPDEVLNQVPTVQFVTPSFTRETYSDMLFPLEISDPESFINVQIHPAEAAGSHPITDPLTIGFERLPALSVLRARYEYPAHARPLLSAVHEGRETDLPVLLISETGNTRSALVNSFNWYRLFHAYDDQTRDMTGQLMSGILSWTMRSPDLENLTITTNKRSYQEGDEILFRARLTDETGAIEADAIIDLVIEGEGSEERMYVMRHHQSGEYLHSLEASGAGNYRYRAEARKAERVIDQSEGEFSITPSNIEFTDTRRDDEMLRNLADLSNGIFLDSHDRDRLIHELEIRQLVEPIVESDSTFNYLYQYYIWFIVVLALLTLEWFLRRKLALP